MVTALMVRMGVRTGEVDALELAELARQGLARVRDGDEMLVEDGTPGALPVRPE